MAVQSAVKLSNLAPGLRLDAEYYQPRYLADARRLSNVPNEPIRRFAAVTDGIHASPDEVEEEGVLYLSAKCVKDNLFALGDALRISESQHAANPRTSLREHDVLITTVGTIGNVAVVQRDLLPANCDRHLRIIRIQDPGVDPYFVATFLNCEYGRFQSIREATGNVQLNLFIEKIRELLIPALNCAPLVAQQTREAYARRKSSVEAIKKAEAYLLKALGLEQLDLEPQRSYTRSFRELQRGNRFGAEYYMPCKQRVLQALAAMPHRTIGECTTPVRELWDPTRAPKGEVVRNFNVTDALEPFLDDSIEPQFAVDIGSSKKRFQSGDVVISRLRSYLKEIAIVQTTPALASVGSSEFVVLRPKRGAISPETLMVFLRSPLVQTILQWSQDGSNHPRFTEEDLLAIPVPDKTLRLQGRIDELVRIAIKSRREADRLLRTAKRTIENAIARVADRKPR